MSDFIENISPSFSLLYLNLLSTQNPVDDKKIEVSDGKLEERSLAVHSGPLGFPSAVETTVPSLADVCQPGPYLYNYSYDANCMSKSDIERFSKSAKSDMGFFFHDEILKNSRKLKPKKGSTGTLKPNGRVKKEADSAAAAAGEKLRRSASTSSIEEINGSCLVYGVKKACDAPVYGSYHTDIWKESKLVFDHRCETMGVKSNCRAATGDSYKMVVFKNDPSTAHLKCEWDKKGKTANCTVTPADRCLLFVRKTNCDMADVRCFDPDCKEADTSCNERATKDCRENSFNNCRFFIPTNCPNRTYDYCDLRVRGNCKAIIPDAAEDKSLCHIL